MINTLECSPYCGIFFLETVVSNWCFLIVLTHADFWNGFKFIHLKSLIIDADSWNGFKSIYLESLIIGAGFWNGFKFSHSKSLINPDFWNGLRYIQFKSLITAMMQNLHCRWRRVIFMTYSWHIHDIFMTFMTYSWHIHDIFMTWHIHVIAFHKHFNSDILSC